MILRWMIIAWVVGIGPLQSCAVMPSLNNTASALFLKPYAKISRQRDTVISPLSHIGFYIDSHRVRKHPDYIDNALLKPRLDELYEGATQAFTSTFAQYTSMDNPKSATRSMDFIVHAQIIDMTLTEETLIENPRPEVTDKTLDEQEQVKVFIPTDYLNVKLVLKDARSHKLIDIAYLQTRSGTLDYQKGYAVFAEYSLRYYLKAITQ